MYIFYHGDMDGMVSAALFIKEIDKAHKKTNPTFRTREFKYGETDYLPKSIGVTEEVIFLDCCPEKEELEKICKMASRNKVTILDHHISRKALIDEYTSLGIINGMSYIGASASLITYAWFEFDKDIRRITTFLDKCTKSKLFQEENIDIYGLKFVNDWDIWSKLYLESEKYKIAFETEFSEVTVNNYKEICFSLENPAKVTRMIRDGNIMQTYFNSYSEKYLQRFGYEAKYNDKKIYVLNIGVGNSKVFGNKIKKYDAVLIYCFNGEEYQGSIYTEKEDFDCSKFAEEHNGGGHKKAAGFKIKELPDWLKDKGE